MDWLSVGHVLVKYGIHGALRESLCGVCTLYCLSCGVCSQHTEMHTAG